MFNFPPTYSLFSLNFSSACQGPFMASKTKNMCHRLRNLGTKFSETSFPLKTYSTQIGRCYHLRQHFKTFDSNNSTLSSMIFSTFSSILIHFPCENRIGSDHNFSFENLLFLILVTFKGLQFMTRQPCST